MRYREKLSWILDKSGMTLSRDEKYRRNIDFVHSLGLRCDCVGWSELDLSSPDSEEILDKIEAFCRSDGWKARGIYERSFTDVRSDWYELRCEDFKGDGAVRWDMETPFEDGSTRRVCSVKAYMGRGSTPRRCGGEILVSERFRDACASHGIPDVDFCWVRDDGRYAAGQYFMIFVDNMLNRVGCGSGLDIDKHSFSLFHALQRNLRYNQLGGSLSRLADMFYDLDVRLPEVYLAEDLPAGGFAHAYRKLGMGYRSAVLVHRDTAGLLLCERALSERDLLPVPVVQELPLGYEAEACEHKPRPVRGYIDRMYGEYMTLKSNPRPERRATDAMALKLLRSAKKENRDRFSKALPRKRAEQMAETAFAALASYYLVCDGGQLSDEYRFLSLDEAQEDTRAFLADMGKEELLADCPVGVVFAKGADGDSVLLLPDGRVQRFSHEAPEVAAQWPCLAQFFADVCELAQ